MIRPTLLAMILLTGAAPPADAAPLPAPTPAIARVAFPAVVPILPATASAVPLGQADASANDNAHKLVALFADKDWLVAVLRRDLPRGYAANAQMQALEADYPGITDYVVKTILPNAERRMLERAPRMWEAMASFFTANLSDAQLGEIVAFYSSPAGRHMTAMLRGADVMPMASAIAKAKGNATGQTVAEGARDTLQPLNMYARLTPGERARMNAFTQSDAGRKWSSIMPTFTTLVAGLQNAEAAKALPERRVEFLAAVDAYKRDHPKKT